MVFSRVNFTLLYCVVLFQGCSSPNYSPWTYHLLNIRPERPFRLSTHTHRTTQKPQTAKVTCSLQFQYVCVCCCNKGQRNLRRLTVTSVTRMAKITCEGTLPKYFQMDPRTVVADCKTNAINHIFQFKPPNSYYLFRQFPVIFVQVRQ
jgi:hypothetical protein